MNIKVRGISYFVEKHQNDDSLPTLVFLHGFLGSGQIFNEIITDVKSVCNPVTIDLLGHGETEGAELHYRFSTKEQVADLCKLIGEQLSTPLFLYGYSMGARLALQIALFRPDLVQGMLLESGTFGIEDITERQARQALDASSADQIMGNYHGFLKSWTSKPMFQNSSSSTRNLSLKTIQDNQDPTWMANSLLGFGTGTMPCLKKKLFELGASVQLIVGDKDSKFVGINQNMKKEISGSKLTIVKDSNHRVHFDQPKECIRIIKKFITKNRLP